MKNHTKKEITWIFSYFGPLISVEYNGMSGKVTVIYDIEKFKEEITAFWDKNKPPSDAVLHQTYYWEKRIEDFSYDEDIKWEYKWLMFDTDYEKITNPATWSVYTLNGKNAFKKSDAPYFSWEYPKYYEEKSKEEVKNEELKMEIKQAAAMIYMQQNPHAQYGHFRGRGHPWGNFYWGGPPMTRGHPMNMQPQFPHPARMTIFGISKDWVAEMLKTPQGK